MTRKEVINKKVVRAITLGLSAVILSTPMTALASDGTDVLPEDNNNNVGQQEKKEPSVCDTVQETLSDETKPAVETAVSDAAAVKADVVVNVKEGEVVTGDEDLSKAVIDAATPVSGNGTPIATADEDIKDVDEQLVIAETMDVSAGMEVKKAEAAVKDASDTAGEAVKIVEEANEKADEHLDNIKNAETIDDANAAHAELGAAVTKAKTDLDAKVEEYNTAKDNYDKAVAKVAEYEKMYNDAIATAGANAEEAAKELAEAKANAEALNKAVVEAKNAVDASAAMEIVALEKKTAEDGGLVWGNQDELFKVIMKNYYIPEVLKINDSNVSIERIQGKDNNDYNYFKVNYSVDLTDETPIYYNYKMKNDNSHECMIEIFEKRLVEISEDQNKTPDRYFDVKTGEEIDVSDGTLEKTNDGKYVLKKTDGTQVTLRGEITQNWNWKNSPILLDQENDSEYRQFVNDAIALSSKYQDLLDKSDKAEKSVEAAEKEVKKLEEAISELEGKSDKSEELGKLSLELKAAEDKLAVAQKNYEELEVKLDNAEEELDKIIEELTPDTINTETDDEDADEDINVTAQPQGAANPATPVTTIETAANPTAVQPAVNTPNANADAGQGIVNIEDEATPLAAGIGGTEDITDAQKEDVKDAVVTIKDEATPLAPTVEEKAEMSWWWLLIVALLGATGYKMYKEHQKKKEDAQEV